MLKQALLLSALFGFGVSNIQANGCCSSAQASVSTKSTKSCGTKSCDTTKCDQSKCTPAKTTKSPDKK